MATNKKAGGAWKESRHDKWYTLAKEQGYRSRAAFKLIQLNKKYNFLESTKSCLDLGAAPGGWLQVAAKFMPVSSLIIGVDLVPIKKMRGVTTIQADITTPECKTLIKKELQGWDVDLVLHDGAPNVAGGQLFSRDAYQQNELVIHALRLATHFLRPKGHFITKVFRSSDYNALLWVLQQLFESVDVTKPMASRNASAEIFVVCRYYKAPKKIDPFLLDPSQIFQQFDESAKKTVDVFKDKGKTARSRQGYDDSAMNGIIYKECDVMELIRAEDPIPVLGSYNSLTFDTDDSRALLQHTATTAEIRSLCEDLKVLGKGDFKSLLKWRKKIQLWLRELRNEKVGEADAKPLPAELTEAEQAEVDEVKMTEELVKYREKLQRQQKQQKRKKHELKMKNQHKMLINKNNMNEVGELIGGNEGGGVEEELFKLNSISNADVLSMLDSIDDQPVDGNAGDGSDSDSGSGSVGVDSDDDENDYYNQLERDLDGMYARYKQKRNIIDKKDLEAKAAEEEEQFQAQFDTVTGVGKKRKRSDSDGDSEAEGDGDDSESEEARPPLLVSLDNRPPMSAALKAKRWFDRDIFSGLDDTDTHTHTNDDNDSDSFSGSNGARKLNGKLSLIDMMNTSVVSSDSDDDDDSDNGLGDDSDDSDSRWLVSSDAGAKSSKKSASTVAPVKQKVPLIGLDSLSKTRAQLEAEHKENGKKEKLAAKQARRQARNAAAALGSSTAAADDDDEMIDVSSPLPAENDSDSDGAEAHMLVDLDSKKKAKRLARKARRAEGNDDDTDVDPGASGFEEVAVESDYSGDDEAIATTLALGTKAIVKKQRTDLFDTSYNRYSVDYREQQQLPQWFLQEERLHNTANLPVTKEEVSALKDRLRAINAKPIKKIAEAASRKKARTERRWLKIKGQMDDIANSTESGANTVSKIKQMEKLVAKKDKRKTRGDRKYVITKKGGGLLNAKAKGGRKGSGPVHNVDKRLKKDKRGVKRADERSTKRQKTTNKRRRNQ